MPVTVPETVTVTLRLSAAAADCRQSRPAVTPARPRPRPGGAADSVSACQDQAESRCHGHSGCCTQAAAAAGPRQVPEGLAARARAAGAPAA